MNNAHKMMVAFNHIINICTQAKRDGGTPGGGDPYGAVDAIEIMASNAMEKRYPEWFQNQCDDCGEIYPDNQVHKCKEPS